MRNSLNNVDFSVLVDIISNMAGMMLLLACFALMARQEKTPAQKQVDAAAKPISFPLAYIPDKRSVIIVLKYHKMYFLPEVAALQAVAKQAVQGKAVKWLDVTSKDKSVTAKISVTPTATGFRFMFRVNPDGGIPTSNPQKLTEALRDLVRRYPPKRFFYVVHSWPEEFNAFRDIREFLHQEGVEVGWTPRSMAEHGDYEVVYSIGEYSQNLSSIKAQ